MNERFIALQILIAVFENGRSLTNVLPQYEDHEHSALIKQYAFGATRWYFQSRAFLQQLLTKKIKAKDYDIELLLILGIYELSHMSTSEHAVVNECVNVTKELDKEWAAGLVNAILRNFIRKKAQLNDNASAHPKWLIKQLQRAWPDHWQAIIEANNAHPPMTLRVNHQKTTPLDYLEQHQINGETVDVAPEAIRLTTPKPVAQLPGFSEGKISIQDQSAQLAAHLLQLKPGLQVLDACAAPGGKTCHMLELEPKLKQVTALDISEERTKLIVDNLKRLGLSANIITDDANQPENWWDKELFDRILIDAPCSATGVIRRHPDIKFHRTSKDITNLNQQQQHLLEALWPLLKPGGLLLYATCSVLPQENDDIIAQFLTKNLDAVINKIELNIGLAQPHGLQILPEIDAGDGFYYALIEKSIP